MVKRSRRPLFFVFTLLTVALMNPRSASAWGDEGHNVVALIAEHYVDPAVRSKVATLIGPTLTL
jgi:hypothetical protein